MKTIRNLFDIDNYEMALIGEFIRPDIQILSSNTPCDPNEPDRAGEAVELSVPTGFSIKAKAMMSYLDDTGFIFVYKGRLVLTDESLCLTQHGDGSANNPYGGPRMVCDSWEELERFLEIEFDYM